jgi:hypothetical protein
MPALAFYVLACGSTLARKASSLATSMGFEGGLVDVSGWVHGSRIDAPPESRILKVSGNEAYPAWRDPSSGEERASLGDMQRGDLLYFLCRMAPREEVGGYFLQLLSLEPDFARDLFENGVLLDGEPAEPTRDIAACLSMEEMQGLLVNPESKVRMLALRAMSRLRSGPARTQDAATPMVEAPGAFGRESPAVPAVPAAPSESQEPPASSRPPQSPRSR